MATPSLSQTGSVGEFIGAALESAGHLIQSDLLDFLSTTISGSSPNAGFEYGSVFGYFIFVLCCVAGLFQYAVNGNYRLARALIIGPALFYFAITVRVSSNGANWCFATAQCSNQPVIYNLEGSNGGVVILPSGKTMRVSWLFSKWNEATSSIVSSLASALRLTQKRGDVMFMQSSDRYLDLFRLGIADPKLKMFVQLGAVNKCAGYYVMQKEYHSIGTNSVRQAQLAADLQVFGKKAVFSIEETGELLEYFRQLGMDQDVAKLKGGITTDLTLNCEELWKLSCDAVRKHAVSLIDSLADINRPPGVSKQDVIDELSSKFDVTSLPGDPATVDHQLSQKYILLVNEITARMLLREIRQISPKMFQLNYAQHSGFPGTNQREVEQLLVDKLIVQQEGDEYEEKGDYFMAILAMPYIQGMILCFLSILFPIYCFLLLIPSKQHSFFTWFGLWAWVKSWDFGFAVVMMLDKVLYGLLPHGSPMDDATLTNPGLALKSMLEVDPTYSAHTYYNLLATCMAAVPILSGMAMKRASGEILDLIGNGFTQFSGKIGGAMSSMHRSLHAQTMANKLHANVNKAMEGAMATAMKDPLAVAALTLSIKGKAGEKLLGKDIIQALQTKGLLQPLLRATSEQQRMIFNGIVKQRIKEAGINEIYKKENREYSVFAVGDAYYSHDFWHTFSGDEQRELIKANNYFPMAKGTGADEFANSLMGSFLWGTQFIPLANQALGSIGLDRTKELLDREEAQMRAVGGVPANPITTTNSNINFSTTPNRKIQGVDPNSGGQP